ncbi:MAG: hypothetical protein MK132_20965 [Lentisphaerales bacterium]|nr:hypothetical protein [Lentisphaerales bacterium]
MTPFKGSVLIRENLYTSGRISSNIAKKQHTTSEAFHSYLDEQEKQSSMLIWNTAGVAT